MKHKWVLLGILALAIFNGVFSPKAFVVFALQGIWYPALLPAPLTFMFILSGLITALLHAMVSAVPAALYEVFQPQQKKSLKVSIIWLCSLVLLSLPTLSHLLMS